MSKIGFEKFSSELNVPISSSLNDSGKVQRSDSAFDIGSIENGSNLTTSSDLKLRQVAKNEVVQASDTKIDQGLVNSLNKISGRKTYKMTRNAADRRKMIKEALEQTNKPINDATLNEILKDCTRGVKAALLDSEKLSLSQKDMILNRYSAEIIAYADKYNFELRGHYRDEVESFISAIENLMRNPESEVDLSNFRYDKFYDIVKDSVLGAVSYGGFSKILVPLIEEPFSPKDQKNTLETQMKRELMGMFSECNGNSVLIISELKKLDNFIDKIEVIYTPSQIASIKNKTYFDDLKEFFAQEKAFVNHMINRLNNGESISVEDFGKDFDKCHGIALRS